MTLVLYHTRAQPKRTNIPICRDYCDAPGQPATRPPLAVSLVPGLSRPSPAGVWAGLATRYRLSCRRQAPTRWGTGQATL